MKTIELLAPVGKFENALAAIENGADAIFVGGKAFNARHFADNFEEDELRKIVEYCKLRGVHTHVTVNTLVKEEEFPELIEYVKYLHALGVTALIVQDFGVAKLIKTYFPNIILHASTQMTAHSLEDVLFLESCGFSRVVLARELKLKEIEYIKKNSNVEIETFIHGALCYSYSGQCLLSSMIGGRSGNRGRCAQPCRMTYNLYQNEKCIQENMYYMSPKDICTLSILPQLIEAGIDSFKIEGRMKSPEYVASVTQVYRKYIDKAINNPENYHVEQSDLEMLQSIFNRGGFSEGYFNAKVSREMITEKTPKNIGLKVGKVVSYNAKKKLATFTTDYPLNPGDGLEIWNKEKHTGTGISKHYKKGETFTLSVEGWVDEGVDVYLSKNHQLLKQLRKSYEKPIRHQNIEMKISGEIGKPIELEISLDKHIINMSGPIVEEASNAPCTEEQIIKQLTKLGSTSFRCDMTKCDWPENAYIGIRDLNQLRRDAVEALEKKIINVEEENSIDYVKPTLIEDNNEKKYVALVTTLEQLQCVSQYECISGVYWEWAFDNNKAKEAYEYAKSHNMSFYIALPYVIRNEKWKQYEDVLLEWDKLDIKGYLIRTYGEFKFVEKSEKEKIIDFNMNIMNNNNIYHWVTKGATRVTPSMELSIEELGLLRGPLEKIVYGSIPVMTSEQCILGNFGVCQKNKANDVHYLEDRKGSKWSIKTDCINCKMQIMSEHPILIDPNRELQTVGISTYRLQFNNETKKEVEDVLNYIVYNQPLDIKTQMGIFFKPID
ncbi:MAG: DUF3656 domain-containing U32 family peptidase [Cellulosilyticaceae bacterium]